jgi:hypothetical protein
MVGNDPTAALRLAQEAFSGRWWQSQRRSSTPSRPPQALAQFDPVWEALVPRERASVLQLLIERVDYDAKGGEVVITFRPAGLAALGPQQRAA